MPDLFDHISRGNEPLPARMRPSNWEEFLGQKEVVELLRGKPVHSMILYGPPGCGKTTVARILARESALQYFELTAVSAGVKDVREIIEKGKEQTMHGRPVLLFLDEIHRFSKSQQDALLQAVESGWVVLIGATTENPSFEVIGPLLSRLQVYHLKKLLDGDLVEILEAARSRDPLFSEVVFSEEALTALIESSDGDARKLLRRAEIAVRSLKLEKKGDGTGPLELNKRDILSVLQNSVRNYDKAGDNHYDFISAFIKSMRASDPDAAMIYLACMIDGGEDPLFIARRMIVFASEDVGNAYPDALSVAVSAHQALERIGMPEGRIILAQAATFLAGVPKSNASYLAIDRAFELVKKRNVQIPLYLRNAPTQTHRKEGAGRDYMYPHDFPDAFAGQDCRPAGFEEVRLYYPSDRGHEAKIKDRLARLWKNRKSAPD